VDTSSMVTSNVFFNVFFLCSYDFLLTLINCYFDNILYLCGARDK
jgi:hypothetical protein